MCMLAHLCFCHTQAKKYIMYTLQDFKQIQGDPSGCQRPFSKFSLKIWYCTLSSLLQPYQAPLIIYRVGCIFSSAPKTYHEITISITKSVMYKVQKWNKRKWSCHSYYHSSLYRFSLDSRIPQYFSRNKVCYATGQDRQGTGSQTRSSWWGTAKWHSWRADATFL